MRRFLRLTVTPVGRAVHGLFGTTTIVVGLVRVGLVPLGGRLLDGCVPAPLFGLPATRNEPRDTIEQQEQ